MVSQHQFIDAHNAHEQFDVENVSEIRAWAKKSSDKHSGAQQTVAKCSVSCHQFRSIYPIEWDSYCAIIRANIASIEQWRHAKLLKCFTHGILANRCVRHLCLVSFIDRNFMDFSDCPLCAWIAQFELRNVKSVIHTNRCCTAVRVRICYSILVPYPPFR